MLISRTCEYITLQDKRDFVDVIMVQDLEMDHPGGSYLTHEPLKADNISLLWREMQLEKDSTISSFEDGVRGHELGQPLETEYVLSQQPLRNKGGKEWRGVINSAYNLNDQNWIFS